jgi:putative ABC transport system permease protein
MLVPISYNVRSLFVRRTATMLTVLGIAATVAVAAGVLALQQGFAHVYAANGREDLAVFLRPGATSEGVSMFSRDRCSKIIKTLPEIEVDEQGPLASMESYFAVRRFKVDGGETNVPIRGVQQRTFDLRGDEIRLTEGRRFTPGSDEVIVGSKLVNRIRDCQLGDVITLNTTPFRVVGIFETGGLFASEIWGDFDRTLAALERYGPNRVLAKLKPGVVVSPPKNQLEGVKGTSLAERLEEDKEIPAKVMTERDYLSTQTLFLSFILVFLSGFLGLVMGVAAVFTATNTMLSALAARTHEIGILLATGFRPYAIFFSFLLESLILGVLGGLAGCLLTLPINGIETGTTNFQTFTEVAFAFRVTPTVLVTAIVFSLALGLLGGAIPAWRAARMTPTAALRRT